MRGFEVNCSRLKGYCVIFNPSARGYRARAIRRNMDILGGQPVFYATSGPGDARALASRAIREGFETIIAAGGDGTANEVVNGIADEPAGLKHVRFGVLPMGTVNVFARELGLPLNLRRAWEALSRDYLLPIYSARGGVQGTNRARTPLFCATGWGGDRFARHRVGRVENETLTGALAYILAGVEGQPGAPADH